MPDWTYQTVFRPVLSRLSFERASAVAFGTMGLLGRTAAGRAVIRFMGHAAAPAELARQVGPFNLPAPCGLAASVDHTGQATSALSLFGFGLIEVGTVHQTPAVRAVEAGQHTLAVRWRVPGTSLKINDRSPAVSLQRFTRNLSANRFHNGVPVVARVLASEHAADIAAELAEHVDAFSLVMPEDARSSNQLPEQLLNASRRIHARAGKQCLPVVALDAVNADTTIGTQLRDEPSIAGLIVECGYDSQGCRGFIDKQQLPRCVAAVQNLRAQLGPDCMLVTSGLVSEPADVVRLLRAGADLVLVDSGLVNSGPGLPKRVNRAMKSLPVSTPAAPPSNAAPSAVVSAADLPATQLSWFWLLLLAVSLLIGGIMALVIGLTRIVLPYDEEFLGMLRDEICGINDQLLPFMSHDRVTLAGTMLGLGTLYLLLAWRGDREGQHWARATVLASAFVGFLSFFLFLGFGYFDPFHAFVTLILFQFLMLALKSPQSRDRQIVFDLDNSPSWRKAMWGQLLFVVHGLAILTAGIVISSFGVTQVFVEDDLQFMQTTAQELSAANPRLVPLVAHDRASFGGMLMATGITVFLSSLWGWQRGQRWLWTALAIAGTVAYGCTTGIHWHVGYTSLRHLIPAYGGLIVLWVALALSREWMFEDATSHPDRK